ncbi:MAG: hypothetical protein K8S20_18290 [Chloroflexi bacterium]|nr:hypothetical protein [Chloroflexota bacterium]
MDIWDLRTYYHDGSWFQRNLKPYRDVFSEYPQVPTYLFGWLQWFGRSVERPGIARQIFFHAFTLCMLMIGYINFILVEHLSLRKSFALLLFLPGPLYFNLYRFDILPSFLCIVTLFLIKREKWSLAALVLAVAVMTKWYPVLLVPPIFAYYWSVKKKIPWSFLILFTVIIFLIFLPTWIDGGMSAVLVPYKFHLERSLEAPTLPGLTLEIFRGHLSQILISRLFLLLQILFSIISLFIHINKFENLVRIWIVITGFFVLFSGIYSPQWILWVLPIVILILDDWLDAVLVLAYGLLAYLGFPVVYDGMPSWLSVIILLNAFVLLTLIIRSLLKIEWKFAYPGFWAKLIGFFGARNISL